MATIDFDADQFRQALPAFADETQYPDAILQVYWDTATCYISDQDYGCLTGACRRQALNLMTAHLCVISENAQKGSDVSSGQVTNFITSSTVDKVSVSVAQPPAKDQWSWWLSTTPYGQQLQALLSANIAGGLYIGGLPEKSAFRKVGGVF